MSYGSRILRFPRISPGFFHMITVDKRKCRRLEIVKSGLISLEDGEDVPCNIRDMSPFGACLELENYFEIPEKFSLVVEADHIEWPCRVIWRSRAQIGVAFK
jgi:hypothetical protein